MPLAQSDWQSLTPFSASPTTLASGATIAPVSGLVMLTGNTAITTITPPINGPHAVTLVFAGTAGVATGGNINATVASVAGLAMMLVYNVATGKYIPVQ